MTHICISKIVIIGSDNGLSPGRRQAIIWSNAGILLIRALGINFSGIRNQYIFIQENASENVVCKMASISSRSHWVNLYQLESYATELVIIRDDVMTWKRFPHYWILLENSKTHRALMVSKYCRLLYCLQAVEQPVDMPLIWDTIALMWHHCKEFGRDKLS